MSGGLGKNLGSATSTAAKRAGQLATQGYRDSVAQMASQKILMKPTDAAGKKMYKEALALRSANPGIVGAAPGTSFQYAPPVQNSTLPQLPGIAGLLTQRLLPEQSNAASAPAFTYTIPGQAPVVRDRLTGPIDPRERLVQLRGPGAGTFTPAQLRLSQLLGE